MRKKVKYVLGILTAGIFCGAVLAGCGGRKSLSARELAAETASNLEKIESYEGNVFLDLQAAIDMEEYGISSMEMNIGLDVNVQETMDPAAAAMYGSMDISMLGQQQSIDIESYTVEENGSATVYNWDGGSWTRSKSEFPESGSRTELYESIAKGEIQAELEAEPGEVNGREVIYLSAGISGDTLKDLIEFSLNHSSLEGDNVDWDAATAQVRIGIYSESRLPAEVVIDCREFGNAMLAGAMGNLAGGELSFDTFEVSTTYDEYDCVDLIQVPQAALEGASAGGSETDLFEGEGGSDLSEDSDYEDLYPEPDLSQEPEELSPNPDGSYTMSPADGSMEAVITFMDGQEYCYSNPSGFLSSMPSDPENNVSYMYTFEEYYTAEELGEYNRDVSWMEEYPEEYSQVSVTEVQELQADGRTISWCQVDYAYDSGYGVSHQREIYGWTQVGDILFQIQVDDYSMEEGTMPAATVELLEEAFGRVELGEAGELL